MRNDKERSFLRFRERPFTALAVTAASLFCQWLNWFVYEKINYAWGITLVTPLVLCMMYHFVQLDSGQEGSFSGRFLFIFAVAVPLMSGIILTVIMLLAAPEISVFSPDAEYRGTVRETIATYAGRFVFTSLYLLIFGVIDALILKKHGQDSRRERK
ncbi:hypothetical protein [uncultured Ruminococcus sp.]|uniref:hypothetical protein n=1 Tax=uncultured Ruminococcus sp. TaxID=165186 RepID=UPI00262447E7|nr:hypothetical protein [uncultured Ruminococcus sp.]